MTHQKEALQNVPVSSLSNDELMVYRAALDSEMRKRGIAFTVGEVGENLAVEYFNATPEVIGDRPRFPIPPHT